MIVIASIVSKVQLQALSDQINTVVNTINSGRINKSLLQFRLQEVNFLREVRRKGLNRVIRAHLWSLEQKGPTSLSSEQHIYKIHNVGRANKTNNRRLFTRVSTSPSSPDDCCEAPASPAEAAAFWSLL